MVTDWSLITFQALESLWQGFILFLPKLIGVLLALLIGWFVAVWVGKLVTEILKRLKFNRIFEKGAWKEALEKAEFKVDASGFVGAVVKWILFIVVLQIVAGILGWTDFAVLLGKMIAYLPNVIVAVLIFVVAIIIADIVEKIVRAAVESARVGYGGMVGVIVKWSIWIFAILAILIQLGVAKELVLVLFQGIVALIVISAAIAFGLGGKEVASEILQDLRKKLKR